MRKKIIGIIVCILFFGASILTVASTIDVKKENQYNGGNPIANFSWEPENATIQDVIIFSDESYDPDGIIALRGWSFGNGKWDIKTPMPSNRRGLIAECVNEKIYAVGGRPAGTHGPDDVGITEEYDPITDSWTTRSSMNKRRSGMGSSVYNDKIYVFGGFLNGVLSTVEEYDPSIDTWTYKTGLPGEKRRLCGASTVGDRIYVIGGATYPDTIVLDNVDIYDPINDSWSSGSPMPTARARLDTIAIGDKIYAIGGRSQTHGGIIYSTVEIYNVTTDIWTDGIPLPIPTSDISAVYCNEKIYITGGAHPDGVNSTVQVYDPINETWTIDIMMTHRRYNHASTSYNNKVYTFGGSDGDPENETVHAMTDEFTPSTTASGEIVYHQYDTIGYYNITLTVMDNDNNSDSIVKSIFITYGPPNKPTIEGPINVIVGTEYYYNFNSTDPDGHDVWYYIDWGDDTFDKWIGPYKSGEEAEINHTWYNKGTYTIRAKGKDTYNRESDWGELTVTIPRGKEINNPLLNWLQSHPNMCPILQKLIRQLGQ